MRLFKLIEPENKKSLDQRKKNLKKAVDTYQKINKNKKKWLSIKYVSHFSIVKGLLSFFDECWMKVKPEL